MVTIYVKSKCDKPTLEYPEYKKIASEYIPEVWEHILKTKEAHIVTCSEHIVEFIGERIDRGLLSCSDVDLIVENKHFKYDEEGVLIDWRYGYFSRNYDCEFDINVFHDRNLEDN